MGTMTVAIDLAFGGGSPMVLGFVAAAGGRSRPRFLAAQSLHLAPVPLEPHLPRDARCARRHSHRWSGGGRVSSRAMLLALDIGNTNITIGCSGPAASLATRRAATTPGRRPTSRAAARRAPSAG